MEITKETIMPDGRPFFAWENEIAMLQRREPNLKKRKKELSDLMKILKVVEIEIHEERKTGDILIRFKRNDVLKKDFKYYPEKYAQIEKKGIQNET